MMIKLQMFKVWNLIQTNFIRNCTLPGTLCVWGTSGSQACASTFWMLVKEIVISRDMHQTEQNFENESEKKILCVNMFSLEHCSLQWLKDDQGKQVLIALL